MPQGRLILLLWKKGAGTLTAIPRASPLFQDTSELVVLLNERESNRSDNVPDDCLLQETAYDQSSKVQPEDTSSIRTCRLLNFHGKTCLAVIEEGKAA
ncbi:MAG: hypothetical protein ACKO0V_11280 [bacterium]